MQNTHPKTLKFILAKKHLKIPNQLLSQKQLVFGIFARKTVVRVVEEKEN